MHPNAPTSAKILSIIDSGHEIEMWYCDDENTRENINPGTPVKIHLRPPTKDDNVRDGYRGAIEYRTRDGDLIDGTERTAGQPRIDNLVKNRSWRVNKQ